MEILRLSTRNGTIIMVFYFLSISFGFSQNLIVNPSFEEVNEISFLEEATGATHGERSISDFNGLLPGWSCPVEFGQPSVHFRFNEFGTLTYPHSGNYAVGLTLYAPAKDDHSHHSRDNVDYLIGALKEKIKRGEKYYFEAWVKNQRLWANMNERTYCCIQPSEDTVTDTSHVHICVQSSNLGLLFIQDSLAFLEEHKNLSIRTFALQQLSPHFNYCELIKKDEEGWFKIQGSFVAPFNAQHFIIGNFYSAEQTRSSMSEHQRKTHHIQSAHHFEKIKDERVANYFLDDLVLRKAKNIEYEAYKMDNCLVFDTITMDSIRSVGLKNYIPSFIDSNPQRACLIGNYDMAFTEMWPNCLGRFPTNQVQDYIENGFTTNDARSVLVSEASEYDILCLNEAHVHSEHRVFLYSLLDSLYEKGYRYLFLEALSLNISIAEYNAPSNYAKTFWGPYVRDPVLGQVIEKAKALGMKVFPYEPTEDQNNKEYQLLLQELPEAKTDTTGWYMEPDGTKHTLALGQLIYTARDRAMAKNILSTLSALDYGKAIVYGGGGHMNNNSCGYQIPLRRWLDLLTEYKIFSFNQATLPYRNTFLDINRPTILSLKDTIYATSSYCNITMTQQKNTDGTIIHQYYSRINQDRPDWLNLDGDRSKVYIEVPEDIPLPFVVVAYNTRQNYKFDVPIDAVEYTSKIDEATLFLPSGCYDIYFVSEQNVSKIKRCF